VGIQEYESQHQSGQLGSHEDRLDETPDLSSAGHIKQPPAPGEESAGPAMTALVFEMRRAVEIATALQRQAIFDKQHRNDIIQRVPFQTDGSGNAAGKLFEVPGGATAYLMRFVLELQGRTPATAALAAGAYAVISSQPAQGAAGTAPPIGSSLLWLPDATQSAQPLAIPAVLNFAHPVAAPALRGPQSFYFTLVGVAAIASLQGSVGINLNIEQPDT
jgi:hypothetical protein